MFDNMIGQQWPSPGKLNLFLRITGRHVNGYHCIQTLFQLIDFGDRIRIFITNNGKIRLFTTIISLNHPNNLIVRAAELLKNYCRLHKNFGADIFLNKVLPIGSGLGGASSNAATTLIILNQEWRCYLKKDLLMQLGLKLGADVPLFIYGHSSFAKNIGEIFTPVLIPEKWYLLVVPPINISTAWVYRMYSLQRHSMSQIQKGLSKISFSNDFEPLVKKMYPEIKIYFKYLSQYAIVRLTGTGSCIYSAFNTEALAFRIKSYLPSWITSIVTHGVNVSSLHQKLLKYHDFRN